MASSQIWRWSAVETAAQVRAKRVSAREVVSAHIERLHAANPALNAVVVDLSEAAAAAAEAADAAQARRVADALATTVRNLA